MAKMKKLLSLPPNLVECFHDIMHADHKEWFCTSDPVGRKLGSGGGTAWLLDACRKEEGDKPDWLTGWRRRSVSCCTRGDKAGGCRAMRLRERF